MLREAFVRSLYSESSYSEMGAAPSVVLDVPSLGSELQFPVSRADVRWLAHLVRSREPIGLLGRAAAEALIVYGATYELLSALPDDVRDSPLLPEVFGEVVGLALTSTMPGYLVGEVRRRERERILAGNPPGDS